MSVLYSILLLDEDLEIHEWLREQGVVVPENIRPARWPTLDEMSQMLNSLSTCKKWDYSGGTIEAFSDKDSQIMYVMPPYPVNADDQVEFYLRGYCKEIIEPLLDKFSIICGLMLIVKNSDAKVVYITA